MKKLTVNKLALGNLKQHRKQYTVMVIGIILAMVFSSSVLFFSSAVFDSTKELKNKRIGKQDIIWSQTTEEYVKDAQEQNIIGEYGFAHIIGSVSGLDEKNYETASVGWLDDSAFELANPMLVEGSMPMKENEIAIESLALSKLGINARVGDTVTLNFNVQNGNEVIDDTVQKEYKLVGILENKLNTVSFISVIDEKTLPSVFVCKDTLTDIGGKEGLVCYANFKNGVKSYSNYENLIQYLESIGCNYNQYAITSAKSVMETNDDTALNIQETAIFAILIVVVLLIASCLSVVNAFNSNLQERKRQIGLFRAVGTTKRQIITIFGREAFIITLIATPISFLIAFLLVKGIVYLMGDDFVFYLNLRSALSAIVFSIASVMISALIPLATASKITPLQAIRNIERNRKFKSKKIKSQKSFTMSRLISKRSIVFGKGKQVAVSLILIVSIVGSGFAFSWYSYIKNETYSFNGDYTVELTNDTVFSKSVNFKNENKGFSETDMQTVLDNEYIDEGFGYKFAKANIIAPFDTSDYRKEITGKYMRDYNNFSDSDFNSENYKEKYFYSLEESPNSKRIDSLIGTSKSFSIDYISFDNEILNALSDKVYDGKINTDKINSGEEIILLAPKSITLYYDESKHGGLMLSSNENVNGNVIFKDDCDFKAGDEIEIAFITADKPADEKSVGSEHTIIPDNASVEKKKVKIGAIVDNVGDLGNIGSNFAILTSNSAMNETIPNLKYKELVFNLNTKCTVDIDEKVMQVLKSISDGIDGVYISSNFGFQQQQKEDIQKFLFTVLSVIILLFSISISIINNAITANIRNSKQKIGILRAVGADEKELVMSYIYQLMSMLLWGTTVGFCIFGVGYLSAYFISKYTGSTFVFVFNPSAAIIFTVATFVVCSVNLWINVKKEMKNSIVENIREL